MKIAICYLKSEQEEKKSKKKKKEQKKLKRLMIVRVCMIMRFRDDSRRLL